MCKVDAYDSTSLMSKFVAYFCYGRTLFIWYIFEKQVWQVELMKSLSQVWRTFSLLKEFYWAKWVFEDVKSRKQVSGRTFQQNSWNYHFYQVRTVRACIIVLQQHLMSSSLLFRIRAARRQQRWLHFQEAIPRTQCHICSCIPAFVSFIVAFLLRHIASRKVKKHKQFLSCGTTIIPRNTNVGRRSTGHRMP